VVGEGDFVVRPNRVSVSLRGPASDLEAMALEDVVPYVDLTGAAGAGGTLPQEVQLRGVPHTVQVVEITPDSVLVKQRATHKSDR
jgi:hypothetical protein